MYSLRTGQSIILSSYGTITILIFLRSLTLFNNNNRRARNIDVYYNKLNRTELHLI